ncbi:sensor histidine kinase [Paenibacillus lacisoli]|uniref:sensor histidine kinase n=1 Tax=Paenibacillus lacisoli TaxID=3064525 RepID=UPI00272D53B2|nr:HAMP domain-containing sensor histidine kinase [Paenibacillus sp. JX-17]
MNNQEEQRRYLELIYRKSVHMSHLIEEISNLAKLDSPHYPLAADSGDLAELIREIAVECYEELESKHMQLAVDVPEACEHGVFDIHLMRRALSNLLINAVKHNPPHTCITLRLEQIESQFLIFVMDDGPTIPEHLEHNLFNPFVRGSQSRGQEEGSGLGLAISAQIAQLHRGSLTLRNLPGHKQFILSLPFSRPPQTHLFKKSN